jgi:hypothetical protein
MYWHKPIYICTGYYLSDSNLSTFNFVAEKGSIGATQFTANASTTLYNSIPLGTHIGRVRDYRFATEADIPCLS